VRKSTGKKIGIGCSFAGLIIVYNLVGGLVLMLAGGIIENEFGPSTAIGFWAATGLFFTASLLVSFLRPTKKAGQ
jgi:hypothetical protein